MFYYHEILCETSSVLRTGLLFEANVSVVHNVNWRSIIVVTAALSGSALLVVHCEVALLL